jgi:RNA ligase
MIKLYDLFPQVDLQAQIDAKMVKATVHPNLPLAILNYTPMAQFTPELWNHVTDLCRGLVYDVQTLEVVARPFAKFWNYADSRHPETLPENFPASAPTITRKLDGSLGIAYPTPRGWAIATRGSFASDQAAWASRWLDSHPIRAFVEGYTPLFEIIYPENQIVVRYAWQGLMLLALVNIETGEELSRKDLEQFAAANEYELVPVFDKPLSSLAARGRGE